MEIEVRDLRNGDWLWINKAVIQVYGPKIGAIGVALYAALSSFSNQNSQSAFPSQETLAKLLGCSWWTVSKYTKILEKNGLISTEMPTHQLKIYKLLKVPSLVKPEHLSLTKVAPLLNQDAHLSLTKALRSEKEGVLAGTTSSSDGDLHANKNYINKNKLTRYSPKGEYGNGDVSFLISLLKEKLELPILDGSEKENRQYAWLLLRKFGGREKAALVVEAARQSEFWRNKIASMKSLYYRGVQLVAETRKGGGMVDGRTNIQRSGLGGQGGG